MPRRPPTPIDELYRRAVAYVDRRGGALIRRGGRSGGAWAGKKKFDPNKLYALGGLTSGNFYVTPSGGGELGAMGFMRLILCRIDSQTATANPRVTTDRLNPDNTGGWTDYFNTTATTYQGAVSDGTTAKVSAAAPFLASDVGKLLLLCTQLTISGALRVLFMRAQQFGADVAVSAYAAASASFRHGMGNRPASSLFPCQGLAVVAHATLRGDLTLAQIQAIYDQTRTAGDIPTSVSGITWAHRWSLRDELAKAALFVTDGQVAPASLADTVTAATVDRMDRQGSPIVRVIDVGVDGRKSYGACGFSSSAYLVAGAGLGIRGNASGFTVRLVATLYSQVGSGYLASCASTTASIGWSISRNVSALRAIIGDGTSQTSTRTLVASDLGVPHLLHLVFSGTDVTFYFDSVAAPSATVSFVTSSAYPMLIGALGTTMSTPAVSETVTHLDGADYIASAADVAADFATWSRTGTLPSIAGKPNAHSYDITDDVVANGGPDAGFPAQVRDRIGTDHLTRVGGMIVENGGVRNAAPSGTAVTTYYRTAATGGLPGAVSGFWAETVWYYSGTAQTQNYETFFSVATNSHSTGGYSFNYSSGGQVRALFRASGAQQVLSFPSASLAVGYHHALLRFDGGQGFLYVDGVLRASSATGLTYELPTGIAPTIGATSNFFELLISKAVMGASGGNAQIDDTEIATAAAAAIAAGKPVGIPGKTLKLWSIPDDVTDAGGKVPALFRERVSGVDHMVLVGSGLQVAQRVERLWSYEAA